MPAGTAAAFIIHTRRPLCELQKEANSVQKRFCGGKNHCKAGFETRCFLEAGQTAERFSAKLPSDFRPNCRVKTGQTAEKT